jgi:hypothetical protein
VVVVGRVSLLAWNHFDRPERADGNRGHATIDFGGSWVMGRMIVEGRGDRLYERDALRAVLEASYPRTDETSESKEGNEAPGAGRSDAARLLSWLIAGGERDGRAIAGPLYPPVNALAYVPLALVPPRTAYRLHQLADLILLALAAAGVTVLSRGRIWLPVALALTVLFPGFQGSLTLGQNSMLSLALLIWGWVLLNRGREAGGGAVWGLLAYKPVWAAAFFLVLPLARRRRAALAMAMAGIVQIALTLPVVGLRSWLDWLQVGRRAAERYTLDRRWIDLSRDLQGIPRRLLLDFTAPLDRRGHPAVDGAALALWLAVLVLTVGVALRRREAVRRVTGPPAAFLLLGAWLVCYHFMYYDALLAFLPVILLFVEPWRLRDRRVPLLCLAALLILENPLRLLGVGDEGQPWSTYVLLVLWAWCGWRVFLASSASTACTSHGGRGSSPRP